MSLRANAPQQADQQPSPHKAFKLGIYAALGIVMVVGFLMYLTDSPAPLVIGAVAGVVASIRMRTSTLSKGAAQTQLPTSPFATEKNQPQNEALADTSDGRIRRTMHLKEAPSLPKLSQLYPESPQDPGSTLQDGYGPVGSEESLPVDTVISELLDPICGQDNPLEALCMLVGDIQTREATQEEGFEPPSNIELFLVSELLDSGLLENRRLEADLRLVRPSRSNMYYLRIENSDPSHHIITTVLATEAALNRAYLLSRTIAGTNYQNTSLSMLELYQAYDALEATFTRQAASKTVLTGDKNISSEADYRIVLAHQLESWVLPYRLSADFRCNVAAGVVNLRFTYTPAELFQKHLYSPELKRQVASTTSDLELRATAYNLRACALLSAGAFIASANIHTVRIACVSDNGEAANTYVVAEFSRGQLTPEMLYNLDDPLATLRTLGVTFELDQHKLLPISAHFELESPDVCPKERYILPELSQRVLTVEEGQDLGAERVSDLSISESAKREELAHVAGRSMDGTTQAAVRAFLDLSRTYPDPAISSAAQNTISALIDGTLSPADAPALLDHFVDADPLTGYIKAMVDNGTIVLPEDWTSIPLAGALRKIDAAHTYDNTPEIRWACFRNFTERVLYNLAHTPGEVARTQLVPDSYFEAHLMAAGSYVGAEKYSLAQAHAERCLELNPYDGRAHMLLINLYNHQNLTEEAIRQAKTFLDVAYSAIGLGHAYHAMSHLQYQAQNLKLAEACMRKCLEFASPVSSLANMELSAYLSAGGHAYFSDSPEASNKIENALRDAGIPVAPSEGLLDRLQCARNQALNAEIFPAARNIAITFAQLTGDDVSYSVAHSIESEPDR